MKEENFLLEMNKEQQLLNIIQHIEDPIAQKTEWIPLNRHAASFITHKLIKKSFSQMQFEATLELKIFYLFPAVFGIFLGMVFSDSFNIIIFIICIILILAGLLLYFFNTKPIIFDKNKGYIWKGKIKDYPYQIIENNKIKYISLNQIYAIQLLRSSVGWVVSYEINLVLKDGKRYDVIGHYNLEKIKEDAETLSKFLQIPLWDITYFKKWNY
ncbi:unnamed protein product [marine sediment metagenome]|uniref:Uncharacterized protein n=1 Tax=marine sediment metagenome TaxID=412755 RepID=X0YX70_9ZZZZ